MPFPVSCFLIGAQKAGTTSLASLLEAQPEICLSSPKEPLFFSKNYNLGVNWYENCFEDAEQPILIDASPDYSRGATALFPFEKSYEAAPYQNIPKRIFEYNPQAKFIYVLRNPVNRTYSSYWHNVRASYEDENFSKLIRSSDRYTVASDYLGQIQNYLEYFDREQFHFVIFEDFVSQPQETLKQCCDFLGCPYIPASEETTHKNASYQLNFFGRASRRLFGKPRYFKKFSKFLKAILPNTAQQLLKSAATSGIPEISVEDKNYLLAMFEESNKELAQLTGLNLDCWNKA